MLSLNKSYKNRKVSLTIHCKYKYFDSTVFKYKHIKLKLRVFLAGHIVAMVTYCATKIIPTCSPMIGRFFDTMIAASTDKEW